MGPPTFRKVRRSFRRFLHFLDEQNVTRTQQITLRHVLDYMKTWQGLEDSTRQPETRRLKLFLRRFGREDLKLEIKTPRSTPEGEARCKPRPYSDQEIAAFREACTDPLVWLFFETSIKTGAAVADLV
jgi:hypothetical protein